MANTNIPVVPMVSELEAAVLRVVAFSDLSASHGRALYAGYTSRGEELDTLKSRVEKLELALAQIGGLKSDGSYYPAQVSDLDSAKRIAQSGIRFKKR